MSSNAKNHSTGSPGNNASKKSVQASTEHGNNKNMTQVPDVSSAHQATRGCRGARCPTGRSGETRPSFLLLSFDIFPRAFLTITLLTSVTVYAYTLLSAAVSFCVGPAASGAKTGSEASALVFDFCKSVVMPNKRLLLQYVSSTPLRFQHEPGVTTVQGNIGFGLSLPLLLLASVIVLFTLGKPRRSFFCTLLVVTGAVLAVPHVWYSPSASIVPSSPSTRHLGAVLAGSLALLGLCGLCCGGCKSVGTSCYRWRSAIFRLIIAFGLATALLEAVVRVLEEVYPRQWIALERDVVAPLLVHVGVYADKLMAHADNLGKMVKQWFA